VASCSSGTFTNGDTVNTGTSALGPHTWTVIGVDNLGNINSMGATYNVQYSTSCGRTILQPLEQVSDPLSLTKQYKVGSTLPIKFQLCDYYGNYIGTAVATLSISKVSSVTDSGDPTVVLDSGMSGSNGNTFRYDTTGQQYIFNLQTSSGTYSSGTYRLTVCLDDGTSIVTYFQLKK
jgi:hypothetical protein